MTLSRHTITNKQAVIDITYNREDGNLPLATPGIGEKRLQLTLLNNPQGEIPVVQLFLINDHSNSMQGRILLHVKNPNNCAFSTFTKVDKSKEGEQGWGGHFFQPDAVRRFSAPAKDLEIIEATGWRSYRHNSLFETVSKLVADGLLRREVADVLEKLIRAVGDDGHVLEQPV